MFKVFDIHTHTYPEAISEKACVSLGKFYNFTVYGKGTYAHLESQAAEKKHLLPPASAAAFLFLKFIFEKFLSDIWSSFRMNGSPLAGYFSIGSFIPFVWVRNVNLRVVRSASLMSSERRNSVRVSRV